MSTNYLTANFLQLGRERRRGGEIQALLGGGDERVREGETSREGQEQVFEEWNLETLVRGETGSGNSFRSYVRVKMETPVGGGIRSGTV
ncbi:hypothetical protein AAC387_Pa10g0842 [Persea americana]